MKTRNLALPTLKELDDARRLFEQNEPRSLFYRAATELVRLAIEQKVEMTVGEAVAVLLQTWNQSFYRFRRVRFDNAHFGGIEGAINSNFDDLAALRRRSLTGASDEDRGVVKRIFNEFDLALGPVGAAKALHLLAPRFFPLWDRAIAHEYVGSLKKSGLNGDLYWGFMTVTKGQLEALAGKYTGDQDLLKALDEYNYCRFSRGWLGAKA